MGSGATAAFHTGPLRARLWSKMRPGDRDGVGLHEASCLELEGRQPWKGGHWCRQWAALLVIGLAFLLRVQGLSFQSLWRDEVDSLRFATQPLAELLRGFAAPGHNGPLYYFLLRPWLELAGESEFSLRFFSVLAGVAAVAVVYHLGRRLVPGSSCAPLVASLLAAVSPYMVWYSQEARMYASVVTLVLGALACLFAGAERGGWRPWLGYVALTGAAFYVHVLAALMVPVHLAAMAILREPRAPKTGVRYLAALASLAVLYTPLALWQLPRLLDPGASGHEFVPFSRMLVSLVSSYVSGVLPGRAVLSELSLLALIASAFSYRGLDRLRPAYAMAAWAFLPLVGLFLLTLRLPMYTARYLIIVLPALLLLGGYGWRALAQRVPVLSIVPVVVIAIASLVSVGKQMATPIKADVRSATGFVASHMEEGDRILFQIPYTRHAFEYYLRRSWPSEQPRLLTIGSRLYLPLTGLGGELAWRIDGPFTNGGISESEVDATMRQLLANTRAVWLVASEVPLWDERLLVQGWLSQHARTSVRAEFTGVSVFRYELP